jgi:hypothetical protein
LPVPEQAPDQPVKTEPALAAAVSVTEVPLVNECEQVAPQLMPAGALVTLPEPDFATESLKVPIAQFRTAGVGSIKLPSIALTRKVWTPFLKPEYLAGLEHAFQLPVSRLHWNVAWLSPDLKENVALLADVDFGGPAVIRVSGS